MRLVRVHIDGFGVYRDRAIGDLDQGLTVLLGPNEAGKSTLLEFFRVALFGVPRGGTSWADYPPLNGGRQGGRLVVEAGGEQWVIERYSGRKNSLQITRPDGTPGTEGDLLTLLGGADRKLFNSVFAFGLDELGKKESLETDEIQDRIYSAGIAGAGHVARRMLQELAQANELLLRPRKPSRITDLVLAIETAEQRLTEQKMRAAAYPQLLSQEEQLSERLGIVRNALHSAQDRALKYQELLGLCKPLEELKEAQTRLRALKITGELPADASAVFAQLAEKESLLRSRLAEMQGERRQFEERKALLNQQQISGIEQLAPLFAAHLQTVLLQREHLSAARRIERSLMEQEPKISEELEQIGGAWTREAVLLLEPAFFSSGSPEQLEKEAFELQSLLGQASGKADEIRQDSTNRTQRLERLRGAIDQIQAPGDEDLRRAEAVLAGLQEDVQARRLHQEQLAYAERLELERAAQDRSRLELNRRRLILAFCVNIAVLVLAGWRLAAGDAAFGLMLLTGGVVAAIPASVLLFSLLSGRQAQSAGHGENNVLQDELRAVEERITEALSFLGAQTGDFEAQLVFAAERVAAWRAEAGRRKELQLLAAEVEREVKTKTADLAAVHERTEALSRRLTALQEAWSEWKSRHGLAREVPISGFSEQLRRLERLRVLLMQCMNWEKELRSVRAAAEHWENTARKLLQDSGSRAEAAEADAIIEAFEQRAAEIAACQAAAAETARTDELLLRLATAQAEAAKQLQEVMEAKGRLFQIAGVQSEPEFTAQVKLHEQRRALEQFINTRQSIIDHHARGEIGREGLESSAGGWEQAAAGEQAEIAKLEGEIEALQREFFDVQRSKQELEYSAELTALENEIGVMRAQLERSLCEWVVREQAQALIKETLVQYATTRQPAVLARASAHFAFISGEYERVVQEHDRLSLAVLDRRQRRLLPEQLSRGTLEQLYLSLRLGLAEEFAKRSCALPIVMDDVLVNFDPGRARRVAERLLETAGRQQVLLFTCHPATVEMFRGLSPKAAVIELQRPGAADPCD